MVIDDHLRDLEFVKFFLFHMDTDQPAVYFMNTGTHRCHCTFSIDVDFAFRWRMRGEIVYHPTVAAPDGSLPATTDCDAQGAICADGDKKLSNRLERTVSGPGE